MNDMLLCLDATSAVWHEFHVFLIFCYLDPSYFLMFMDFEPLSWLSIKEMAWMFIMACILTTVRVDKILAILC